MTTPAFAFVEKITIDSSNDKIAFEVGGTAYTASIAHGDYYALGVFKTEDIGLAIANAFYVETGSEFIQPTCDGDTMQIAAYNGTIDVYWATSATTFDAALIGEDLTSTVTYTTTIRDTTAQPTSCIYFAERMQADSIKDKKRLGSVAVSLDGTPYSHLPGGLHATREILTGLESKTNILTNYFAWWESIGTSSFYLYDYDNDTATEYVLDEQSLRGVAKTRYAPGVPLYSVAIRMIEV